MDYDLSHKSYELGKTAMQLGYYATAIEHFKHSSDLAPHFKTYELLGECLLQDNEPQSAILYLAASVGLGTNQFRAKYLLAKALLALGEDRDAYKHSKEALVINPDYKSARELFAQLESKGKYYE